jgi:hypothetical protein
VTGEATGTGGVSLDAPSAGIVHLARREALAAAAVAAAVAGLLVGLGPPAGDAPAHLYRTLLAEEGVWIWDSLWYGGHYPFASYSLLYYLPAALVGNLALAIAAVVASAALFASISVRKWGGAAVWPARAFAVLAAGPVYTGTYPWAVGVACSLGALRALQGGRVWIAICAAALALGSSPLAFAVLCLVLTAVLIVRRPRPRLALAVAAGLAVPAGIQLAIAALFPAEARYGFPASDLGLLLGFALPAAAFASRAPRGRLVGVILLVVALACLVAFALPTPFGSNLTRLRTFAFPLALLIASLSSFRPRLLVVPALAAALAYNVVGYTNAAPTDTRSAYAEFWAPALEFVRQRPDANYRVDVVPLLDNWDAWFLPRAGVPLARGWYRQLDLARNPVLYEDELTAAEHEQWLRSVGVKYVVLPAGRLNPLAAEEQARLLRAGNSGLVEVLETPELTIYELPDATPILTGPGAAGVTAIEHERLAAWAGEPGPYLLRVRYTPYLQVAQGDVCLHEAEDGMTVVRVRVPGTFVLSVPGPGALLDAVFGARPSAC